MVSHPSENPGDQASMDRGSLWSGCAESRGVCHCSFLGNLKSRLPPHLSKGKSCAEKQTHEQMSPEGSGTQGVHFRKKLDTETTVLVLVSCYWDVRGLLWSLGFWRKSFSKEEQGWISSLWERSRASQLGNQVLSLEVGPEGWKDRE